MVLNNILDLEFVPISSTDVILYKRKAKFSFVPIKSILIRESNLNSIGKRIKFWPGQALSFGVSFYKISSSILLGLLFGFHRPMAKKAIGSNNILQNKFNYLLLFTYYHEVLVDFDKIKI